MDDGNLDSIAPPTTRSFGQRSLRDDVHEHPGPTAHEIEVLSDSSECSTRGTGGYSDYDTEYTHIPG